MNTPNLPEQKESANAGCVQRVVLLPGYHWCASPNCKTQLSDGSPELCPTHQANACPKCKGRGEVIWSHNEADSPSVKHKSCKACGGTGQQNSVLCNSNQDSTNVNEMDKGT
jgi:hypothetical protein